MALMSTRNSPDAKARSHTRRQVLADTAMALSGLTLTGVPAFAKPGTNISQTEESIREEVLLKATPQRVYAALTDAQQFDRVTRLSAAMQGGMPPGAKPTQIAAVPGSEFVLFGGHITGRQIDLITNERIVQAWRAGNWDTGVYSIARFELSKQDSQTKLVFEHTGFPKGQAEHLAMGWRENYWEPLARFLA
jgi:activator of HSP90 ATPase